MQPIPLPDMTDSEYLHRAFLALRETAWDMAVSLQVLQDELAA